MTIWTHSDSGICHQVMGVKQRLVFTSRPPSGTDKRDRLTGLCWIAMDKIGKIECEMQSRVLTIRCSISPFRGELSLVELGKPVYVERDQTCPSSEINTMCFMSRRQLATALPVAKRRGPNDHVQFLAATEIDCFSCGTDSKKWGA